MQGISQAQNLVDHLAGPAAPTFTSLYSSTMTRAVETASPLARKLGLSLHTDADLVEYDHGLPFYIPTEDIQDRKSTRLNSSHVAISYAVFCLKKKINDIPYNGT